jgi:translation initiation factor 2-alpha kinase 4
VLNSKQCDTLVASHEPEILRTAGVEVIQSLWSNDISAELAQDCRSPEDLLSKYRDEQYSWIITIKQDSVFKVKTMDRKDAGDTDVSSTQLIPWLKAEIRERDQKEPSNHPRGKLLRHPSQPEYSGTAEHEQDVRILVANSKSKKSNRKIIIEQAQAKAANLVQTFLDGPIAAIETTDQVMELIRETKLSDPDSWRKLSHAVPNNDRKYIIELHDLMELMAKQNKDKTKSSFVYNFRTGTCIYYDLEA